MVIGTKKYPTIICISGKAQNGKDTSAGFIREVLKSQGKRVLIAHYGDYVKYIAKTYFNWDGNKDEYGRTLLQYIGTDVIRKQRPNYWVESVIDIVTFFSEQWDYVLIPDCRFPNEYEEVLKAGFPTFLLRVVRDNFKSPLTEEQQRHISETAFDDYDYSYIIENNGTLENLKLKCEIFTKALVSTLEE